jgi:hypothetical protein
MSLPFGPRDVAETVDAIERFRRWCRARFGADHLAITAIRTRADQRLSGGYYVVVACAPARRVIPREPTVLIDVAREVATQFLELGASPTYSGADTVKFDRRDERQNLEEGFETRSSGLVELVRRLAPEPTDADGPPLDLDAITHAVGQIATIARSRQYTRLVGRRRKIDWYIGLTPCAVTATGAVYWSNLVFPGRAPGGRSTHGVPGCPPAGYAAMQLRSSRRRRSASRVVEPAIRALLVESGFFDLQGAVEDTMSALRTT